MELTKKQKQFLKAEAHHLKPVVLLGANGLTEGVMAEIDLALDFHELIKVKIPSEDRQERQMICDAIVRESGAKLVQTIGKTAILYLHKEQDAKIRLPKS